jgi:hypothetical protein
MTFVDQLIADGQLDGLEHGTAPQGEGLLKKTPIEENIAYFRSLVLRVKKADSARGEIESMARGGN